MGTGIITADTMSLAMERADVNGINIGGRAAAAMLRMLDCIEGFWASMMEKVVNGAHDDMPWHVGKTSARFLAVQGAYAMMFGAYTASDLEDLLEHLCEMQEVLDLHRVDKKLLSKILGCMIEKCNEVDSLISVHLNEKWSMERINLVSLAVMRAACVSCSV
ncbi:6,7-dimethyl-8-ribityllumazine synthase family protein [Anaplasma phagocytophilum str. ApWI1]|uniref:6,7-dimethyl-8-ribityllumazine synthase family protein n=1 Tax=Anaplasma phagocytophilum str. ApWI1 TaxID=1359155 RepID=A0A0F3PZD3_ANAPH|nr:6,7-dimethyl-8-ribityllumazine synthase family protein [Anaplasma phagocytophilum str. ApWI1]